MRNSLKAIAILFSIFSLNQAFGQSSNVGIGTSKPDQSAALDINSNSKGLLMPRMSMDQRNLIQSPAQGLVVYQTDKNSGFYYFNGEQWNALNSNNEQKSVLDLNSWNITGNSGTIDGTNFIGTTDAISLNFRVNNISSGKIDQSSSKNTFLVIDLEV